MCNANTVFEQINNLFYVIFPHRRMHTQTIGTHKTYDLNWHSKMVACSSNVCMWLVHVHTINLTIFIEFFFFLHSSDVLLTPRIIEKVEFNKSIKTLWVSSVCDYSSRIVVTIIVDMRVVACYRPNLVGKLTDGQIECTAFLLAFELNKYWCILLSSKWLLLDKKNEISFVMWIKWIDSNFVRYVPNWNVFILKITLLLDTRVSTRVHIELDRID